MSFAYDYVRSKYFKTGVNWRPLSRNEAFVCTAPVHVWNLDEHCSTALVTVTWIQLFTHRLITEARTEDIGNYEEDEYGSFQPERQVDDAPHSFLLAVAVTTFLLRLADCERRYYTPRI